jgi:hypothetical protein
MKHGTGKYLSLHAKAMVTTRHCGHLAQKGRAWHTALLSHLATALAVEGLPQEVAL